MPTPRDWFDVIPALDEDEYTESTRIYRASDAMAVFDEMSADLLDGIEHEELEDVR